MTNHDALNIQLDNIKRYKLYNMIFVNILLRGHLYEFVTTIFSQTISIYQGPTDYISQTFNLSHPVLTQIVQSRGALVLV